MGFRLQSLLDLRRQGEEQAQAALAAAEAARSEAEAEQARLDRAVDEARARLAGRRAEAPDRAADAQGAERFRKRLADAVATAQAVATGHRDGPLAAARVGAARALAGYTEARREREALDKLREREEEQARRVAERRSEDAASDLAVAQHHARRRP
jgi:flagellar export protein FliJ